MWRKHLIVCLLCLLTTSWVAATESTNAQFDRQAQTSEPQSSRRIALVIGNGAYDNKPLANPVNDARAMEALLGALGFQVMRYENLTRQGMRDALREFSQRLDTGGVGLFYFSGHGLRVEGKTMLLPIDAARTATSDVREGIALQTVLDEMSGARSGKLNLVILDACLITASRHDLGHLEGADGTFVSYAAAPGQFAADGAHHGLFTAEIMKAMGVPGLTADDVFQRAAAAVRTASKDMQTPMSSSHVPTKFHFLWPTQDPVMLPATMQETVVAQDSRGVLPKDSEEQYELSFWESIKNSTHTSDYEAYLKTYPNGRFAGLARARIEQLRAAAPKDATPAPPPAPAPKAAPTQPRPTPVTPAPAPKAAVPSEKPPEKASSPPPAPVARGMEIKDCETCPTMISLPGGKFTMGSSSGDPSEKPPHPVSIGTGFAIGKYEVTVEQWNACATAGDCPHIADDANRFPKNSPIRDVSWDDAQKYVKWLSKVSGHAYRLPTEAEWEYAARGGTSTTYWWGDQMRKGTANCKDCGDPWQPDSPAPAGSFAPNPYGLYDMNGSVWEWVSDCWHNSYKGAPADGHTWAEQDCRVRVIRGGSWREGASYMPSSTRFKYDANVRHSQNGFRVLRELK